MSTPTTPATASAAAALTAMWAPLTSRATGALPHGVCTSNRGRAQRVEDEPADADVGRAVVTERDDRGVGAGGHRRDPLVVGVEDRRAGGRQGFDELALRGGDALDAADALGVRRRHRRHDPDVGPTDGAEAGDLAEAAHAHLEHEDLGVGRGGEDRHRQALLVVEAALVGGHPPAGADGRPHEVLGARLADAAGDADDRGCEPIARPRRQRHQRGAGVGDLDDRDRRVERTSRPASLQRRRRPRRRRTRDRRARRRAARTAGPGSSERESNDAPSTSTSGPRSVPPVACGHVGCPDPHRAERYRSSGDRGPDPPRRAVRRPVGRARRELRDGRPRAGRRRSGGATGSPRSASPRR